MSGVGGPYQPEHLKQRAVPVMASQRKKVCPSGRHCAAGLGFSDFASFRTWKRKARPIDTYLHHNRIVMAIAEFDDPALETWARRCEVHLSDN